MKKILLILLLTAFTAGAQKKRFRDYLVLGTERAEQLTSIYLQPLNEGLMYGLTGGWYNSAESKSAWQFDISIITNGSFVPRERLSWTLSLDKIENLDVLDGSNVVRVPTILGNTESDVTFLATVGEDEVQFDAPTGIGLLSTNLLPTALVQVSLGLPANFEVGFRYFPKLNFDDFAVGVVGGSLKYEFTQGIEKWSRLPVAISLFTAYTRLDAQYDFQADGFISGSSQYVDGFLNSWVFEMLFSTKNPIWNVYGGIGYITGDSEFALKGIYTIQLENETLNFEDPFDVQNKISGARVVLGGRVNMGVLSINVDYTFQGYNNLALGFNFSFLRGKSR